MSQSDQLTFEEKIGYKLSKPQLVMEYYFLLFRFLFILSGKRVGKTGYVAYKLAQVLFTEEKKTYWIVGRTFEIISRIWDELEVHAEKLGYQVLQKQGRPYRIINPANGSYVQANSTANGWEHLRGKTVDGVVIDEACLLQGEAYDSDIEPNLMTSNGWCILISNAPATSANWFMLKWELAKKRYKDYLRMSEAGQKEKPCEYVALHFTSYDSPFIKKETLDKKKEELIAQGKLDVWNRQYMAQPPSLRGEVFDSGLNDCLSTEFFFPPAEYHEGRFLAVFDPARRKDKPVLCIWDKKIKTAVKFYEFDKMPAPDLEREVLEKVLMWKCYKILLDDTGGGYWLVDHIKATVREKGLRLIVVGMSLAGGKKNTIIEALKQRIENWSIRFERNPELLRQLEVFTKKETSNGIMQYSAPKGDFDDYVDALAMANWDDMTYEYVEIKNNNNYTNNGGKQKVSNIALIHS